MRITSYLVFNGNAEQAANFYAEALGGKLENLTRYNQFPPSPEWTVPAEFGNLIGHCCIVFPGGGMSVADTLPSNPVSFAKGGNMLTLVCDSVEQAESAFAKLSRDAQRINCPIQKVFYAERYGEFIDRFGVQWAVMKD